MRTKYVILCVVALTCSTSVSLAQQIGWLSTLEDAKQTAIQTNRLILLHFWNDGCPPCAKMEQDVFPRAEVVAAIRRDFVPVKIHVGRNSRLASQYGIDRWPADVIISPQGQLISQSFGGLSAVKYTSQLGQVAASWRNKVRLQYAQRQGAVPPADRPPMADPRLAAGPTQQTPYQSYRDDHLADSPTATQPPYSAPVKPRYGQARPADRPPSGTNTAPPLYTGRSVNEPLYASEATNRLNNTVSSGRQTPQRPYPGLTAASQPTPRNQPPIETPRYQFDRNAPLVASREPAIPSQPSNEPAAPAPSGANPPLALEGYCPVQLAQQDRWVKGDAQWGVSHEGRTYLFAGPREAQTFWDNPEFFAAVLSGSDLVSLVDQGQTIAGCRSYGGRFEDRLYLFSSAESFTRFNANPHHYVAMANQGSRQPLSRRVSDGSRQY